MHFRFKEEKLKLLTIINILWQICSATKIATRNVKVDPNATIFMQMTSSSNSVCVFTILINPETKPESKKGNS